jgi:hypothetical protein
MFGSIHRRAHKLESNNLAGNLFLRPKVLVFGDYLLDGRLWIELLRETFSTQTASIGAKYVILDFAGLAARVPR